MCWRLDRRGGAALPRNGLTGQMRRERKTHAGRRRGPEKNDGGETPPQRRIKESDTVTMGGFSVCPDNKEHAGPQEMKILLIFSPRSSFTGAEAFSVPTYRPQARQ